MMPVRVLLAIGLAMAGSAVAGSGAAIAHDKLPARLAALSPADAMKRISMRERPDTGEIVLSTRKVWDRGRRVEGVHISDVYLHAVVDRADGSIRWELLHELDLFDDRREITGLRYRTGDRLAQARPMRTEISDEDCPGVDAPPAACHVRVRSTFEIPHHVVQGIAAGYASGKPPVWDLHFTDSNGGTIKSGLAPVEAAALKASVQQLRRNGLVAG